MHDKHKTDQTMNWFRNTAKWANTTAANPQLAQFIWRDLAMHFCMLDTTAGATMEAVKTKQYCTRYWGLDKYGCGKGFYPSRYTVQVAVDEAGTMADKKINDMDELAKIPSLKKAEKMYFAGKQYKMVNFQLRDKKNDYGWRFLGTCAADKESLYVRKGKQGYIILNFAMNGHPYRQDYGSGQATWGSMHKYVEDIFYKVDGEYEEGAFCEDYEDADGWAEAD